MKFTDSSSPEAVALLAACSMHRDMVNDEAFAGYEGTKEQFDQLYKELFVIARDEVSLEVEPVLQVIDTYFEYQEEISAGERDWDWYM